MVLGPALCRRSSARALLAVLVAGACVWLPAPARAGNDPGFNGGGPVLADLFCAHRHVATVLQFPDGDVGLAGQQTEYIDFCATPANVPGTYVMRRNADGSPDAGYGGSEEGLATVPMLTRVVDAEVLGDGSVLAFGMQREGLGPEFLAVVRLTPAGAPDPDFGAGGRVALASSSDNGDGDMAVLPDGRIVLATATSDPQSNPGGSTTIYSSPAAFRLMPDGQPDPTFSDDGRAVRRLEGERSPARVHVHVQPTGRVIVAGSTMSGGSPVSKAFVVAFTAAGADDATFNGSGKLVVAGPSDALFRNASLAVSGDGDLLVAGETYSAQSGYRNVMLRTDPDGVPDASWGAGGLKVISGLARTGGSGVDDRLQGNAIAVDASGRIVVAGIDVFNSWMSGGTVARLRADGEIDTSFGAGGFVDIRDRGQAHSVAVDAQGRALVGAAENGEKSTFVWLARVLETEDGAGGGGGGGLPGGGGGSGGGDTGGTAGGSTGETVTPPGPFSGLLPHTSTAQMLRMPNVLGLDESAAKERISAQSGIQGDYRVLLSTGPPPRGRRIGDVVAQLPRAGTLVASSTTRLAPITLTVYAGARSTRCPDRVVALLRVGLRGAELDEAERIVAKQGCAIERNFVIRDVDAPEVTSIVATDDVRNGKPVVRMQLAIPSNVAKNDLFLAFRESPNGLSFAAEDWTLTSSRTVRNFMTVTVKNRSATTVAGASTVLHGVEPGTELHFDVTDVGAPRDGAIQRTDSLGQRSLSIVAPRAGIVDVVAVKTGDNGLSMYGSARLRVRDRSSMRDGATFTTTGGRVIERTAGSFACKVGPKPPCRTNWATAGASGVAVRAYAAADPFAAFAAYLQQLTAGFLSGAGAVARETLAGGGSALAQVRGVARSAQIFVSQFALSSRPLDGAARVIAAGGGNVIAAGGGNAIAAGGGNVIAAGGGNAIAAGGGNAIAAGGGNAIAAGGGNVIAAGGGNVITLAGGSRVIGNAVGSLVPAGAASVIGNATGQAVSLGGGVQLIATGASLFPVANAIAAGGLN